MLRITLAALAALALSAGTGWAQTAQPKSVFDVDAPTMTLGYDGQSDTELTRGYRGGYGGYRGGYDYRGGYGYGGYRGYGYGGYRGYGYGYRGYYGGYYRPYYSYGYYRPYYNYGYYQPYYYSSYYPSYYYAQPYYYGGNYYGCSNGSADLVQAAPLNQLPSVPQVTPPNMPYAPGNGNGNGNGGNFNYDGGPNSPVPMPNTNPQTPQYNPPAPQVNPQTPAIPTKGYLVSLPGSANSGYTYQAYGAQPTTPRTTTPARTNFAFPAYGDTQKSSGFASGN